MDEDDHNDSWWQDFELCEQKRREEEEFIAECNEYNKQFDITMASIDKWIIKLSKQFTSGFKTMTKRKTT